MAIIARWESITNKNLHNNPNSPATAAILLNPKYFLVLGIIVIFLQMEYPLLCTNTQGKLLSRELKKSHRFYSLLLTIAAHKLAFCLELSVLLKEWHGKLLYILIYQQLIRHSNFLADVWTDIRFRQKNIYHLF